MQRSDMQRCRFKFRFRQIVFDVIFLADIAPYLLILGLRGGAFCIDFDIAPDYTVAPRIENEKYKELCRLLELRWDPNNPFRPSILLEALDAATPQSLNDCETARPELIAQHRRDLEDADLIYFWQWRDNTIRSQRVSQKNLEKTRLLLGQKAYEICKSRNISSVWTDDKSKATKIELPR